MRHSATLLAGASLLASASADYSRAYAPLAVGDTVKRAVQSCEQTYGAGSVACGAADHNMCFNPSQGQTCCAADRGYCDQGKYCAPVAGYCCLASETLAACARNARFDVSPSLLAEDATDQLSAGLGPASVSFGVGSSAPASFVAASSAAASFVAASSAASVTFVAASVGVAPTAASVSFGVASSAALPHPTGHGPAALPTSSALPKAGKNGTSPVQVSVARKEQWTLVYMSLGMGVVGLIMATF